MAWSNVGNFLRGSFPLFLGLFTSTAILISAKTCHNYPGTNAGVEGTSGTIEGGRSGRTPEAVEWALLQKFSGHTRYCGKY
jgi:hypothetical protein